MRQLFIDPGAKPGFCETIDGAVVQATHLSDAIYVPEYYEYDKGIDELIIEAQYPAEYIWRDGRRVRVSRKSQQGLSFTAGRLFERFSADRKYSIEPNAWRRLLWPPGRPIPPRQYDHPLPKWPKMAKAKRAIITRLWYAYGQWVDERIPVRNQPDVLEAIGMAHAWMDLTQAQKEAYRVE